jgi:hypothetical protein
MSALPRTLRIVNRVVKVADTSNGAFASMKDVVAPLSPDAHALQWRVLDLGEVIYDERWDLNMPFVEASVLASPSGMPMSFEDVEAFASRTRQVIDGLFVGCALPSSAPRRSDSDSRILEAAEMLVAAIDSTFWLVSAPDDVLARVESRFLHVETVDAQAVGLSTWPRNDAPE